MRSETPPWARDRPDDAPITTYTLHLGGEQYEFGDVGVAQALSDAGARVTARTEGQR